MKKLIILTLLISLNTAINAQNKGEVKKIFAQEAEKIHEGNYSGNLQVFESFYADFSKEIILQSANYETDTLPMVRRYVIMIINRAGQKSKDTSVTSQVVEKLSFYSNDTDRGVRSAASSYLKKYPKTAFSSSAKSNIKKILGADISYYKNVIQLVGYLDMEEEISTLELLLKDTLNNNAEVKWKIRTALARLGQTESIDYCVNYAKSKGINNMTVKFIYSDLAYTRQPETIGFLVSELFNDEKNCRSSNPDSRSMITCSYRIMELLAPTVEDFPYKAKYGTQLDVPNYEEALQNIKIWFTEHPYYKINREKF